MLPFELLSKISEKLDFLTVNNFCQALNVDGIDKRIVRETTSNLICAICFHNSIDEITTNVLQVQDKDAVSKGMRYVSFRLDNIIQYLKGRN